MVAYDAMLDPIESTVDSVEPAVDRVEPAVDCLEPPVDCLEPTIYVLPEHDQDPIEPERLQSDHPGNGSDHRPGLRPVHLQTGYCRSSTRR